MIQLTTEQIEKYVNQYFDEMIAKDSNYIGNCDSSWIYDATDWLCMREEFQQDYIHEDSVREFANYSRVIWNKMYNERYAYDDYSNITEIKYPNELKKTNEFYINDLLSSKGNFMF